jgi:hypothetical protein
VGARRQAKKQRRATVAKKLHIEISLRDGYNPGSTTTLDAPTTTQPEKIGKMVTEIVQTLIARDQDLWADTEVETKG